MTIPLATYNYQDFISESSTKSDGCSVLFEGQITNRDPLQKRLECGGDNTVLIELAYKKWGPSFINYLEGNFSIVLFDKERRTLYFYRDRLGSIPCYYYKTDHFFACSTEVKSILKLPNFSSKLDRQGLADYLSYGFVHAPHTIISGISQLLPGHYLKLTDEDVEIKEYYALNNQYDYTISGRTEDQHQFHIDQLLNEESYDERFIEEEALKVSDYNELQQLVQQVDHPNNYSISYLQAVRHGLNKPEDILFSSIGNDVAWGIGGVFDTLLGFQDYRWLLSYPKPIRKIISPWISIPFKKELGSTYKQLIFQDYYDLDCLYPTYYRRCPISLIEQGLSLNVNDMPRALAENTVIFQTNGFDFPYLSKVGMLEMYSAVSNAQLPALHNAKSSTKSEILTPFLDLKFQRYLSHIPDEIKVRLRTKTDTKSKRISNEIILSGVSREKRMELLYSFSKRSFFNRVLSDEILNGFSSFNELKKSQLISSILLLELWLTENNIND